MMNFLSRADLKNQAKDKMTGRYFYAVMLTILCSLTTMFLSSCSSLIEIQLSTSLCGLLSLEAGNLRVSGVCSLVALFFSTICEIFQIGISLFYLSAACGRPNAPGNLFWGFHDNFKRSFIIAGILSVTGFLCFLPVQLLQRAYNAKVLTDMSLLPAGGVLQIALLIVYFYITLSLSQSYFLLLDFPQYDAWQIMKLSCKTMRGHKLRLFLLQLSFLPLILLCIPTFGFGTLWLSPYMSMTYALFFLDIMHNNN